MRYLFKKSTEGERRLIEVAARAGASFSNKPGRSSESLSERLRNERSKQEQEDKWTPRNR